MASVDVVQLLLDHGAAVDVTDAAGQSCLIKGAEMNNVEIVQKLLAAGANVNAKNGVRRLQFIKY